MELTLTGASLTSSSTASNTNDENKASPSLAQSNATNKNADANSSKTHSHSHSHHHHHDHECAHNKQAANKKDCCKDPHSSCASNAAPSNYQPVQSIPKEKLTSNPTLLFQALVQSIKVGNYDTFLYLCNLVTEFEAALKEHATAADASNNHTSINTNSTMMQWGQDKEEELLKERGHVVKEQDLTKHVRTALAKRTEEGHSLAHWAAKQAKDVRFMQHLASIPTLSLHLPSTDKVGMRPLHWAATEGSIPLVNLILSHLDSQSSHTHHHSSSSSSSSNNRAVVVDRSDPINCRDLSGCTPLLIAAQYGHADLAAFLIKRGADPNAVDDARDTALHWGAYKGSIPICGLLLHLNGIVQHLESKDSFGQSPLHLASLRGNTDTVAYLLEEAQGLVERQSKGGGGGSSSGGKHSSSSSPPSSLGVDAGGIAPKNYVAQLLTSVDRDGKTPLDLAIKKKKMAVEVLLRQAMNKHVTSSHASANTLLARMRKTWTSTIQPALSYKYWLVALGLIQDANGSRPPKSIFWFVISQLVIASFVELVIYVPLLGDASRGRTWDWMWLHTSTIFFLVCTWINFILVHVTNPGMVGGLGRTAGDSMNDGLSGAGAGGNVRSVLRRARNNSTAGLVSCGEDNAQIGREMNALTLELRREYDETLERWATNPYTTSDGKDVQLCHSCRIVKPLRSKHCRVLGKCVLLFDHHCPFVGTTIGLYNYKYFYLFVSCLSFTEILFTTTGIIHLKRSPDGQAFEWGLFLCALWLSLFVLMAGGLTVYHTQLIMKNLTTNEHQNQYRYNYLKDSFGRYWNPFERGFANNLMSRFLPGKQTYTLVEGGQQIQAVNEQERERLVHNSV